MQRRRRLLDWFLAAVVLYAILLFGPIAGFDAGRIVHEIAANPQLLLQQLAVGLVNGAIIAIIALGYTLVYGILELINFAHGDLFMLGVFAALSVVGTAAVTPTSPAPAVAGVLALAFVVAAAFCAAVNVLIERLAYRPLRHAPRL